MYCAAILCVFSSNAYSQKIGDVVDEIVAVVGDEIVLRSYLDTRLEEMKAQGFKVDNEAECAILEELLYEKLLVNQAKLDSLEATPDEIESQLERRLDYYISQFPSVEDFEKFYGKTAAQLKEDFRSDVRDQLLVQKMQAEITRNINVTPMEVKDLFESIPKDSLPLIESQVQYSQIVIKPEVSPEETLKTIDALNKHRDELLESPYKFGIYATLYSDDPGSANSQNQGCYRKVEKGTMVPEFEEAVLNLQPGEITVPFETDFGWHIARLEEKSGKYYSVCHILNNIEPLELDLQKAKIELDTIKYVIESDSLSFQQAANELSHDEETKQAGGQVPNPYTGGTKFELSQLDPQITLVLNQLEPGEVSDPVAFTGQNGQREYRIFLLTSRSDAHVADYNKDYALLKRMTESELQNKALEEWIKKKLAITFKRLMQEYQNCTFRYDWAAN